MELGYQAFRISTKSTRQQCSLAERVADFRGRFWPSTECRTMGVGLYSPDGQRRDVQREFAVELQAEDFAVPVLKLRRIWDRGRLSGWRCHATKPAT
jgi:hypothetical protein